MQRPLRQVRTMVAIAAILILIRVESRAQNPDSPRSIATSQQEDRSIEDLNLRGGDVGDPTFSDALIPENSAFRQSMLKHGLALRFILVPSYTQNTLAPPSKPDEQKYVGQYPYESSVLVGILSTDLRQLGLRHAQFRIAGVWDWVSWRENGPKILGVINLYLYKEFANDRVEMKAGYDLNQDEFVGMQIAGSTATAGLTVFNTLPNEVGLSFFPVEAPLFNLLVRGPSHFYLKSGVQRSLDPNGGVATWRRDKVGLRFDPKGDKALLIDELGWRRKPDSEGGAIWFRAGYMRNWTRFRNLSNGKMEPGNHFAYALFDDQLRRPDVARPSNGLYIGGSAMTVASQFNAFSRYYEARLYDIGPFRKRPQDIPALVASYSPHSRLLTDALAAEGKPVSRATTIVSGIYNIHAAPGNFLSLGLSYIHGPAVTPRLHDALTFTATYSLFF